MAEENHIKLECPQCSEENKINLSKAINCKKCNKSLLQEKYQKVLVSASTAVLLGGGVGMVADSHLSINRLSVKNEYKMMKTCMDDRSQYRHFVKKNDIDICACAVEGLRGAVDVVLLKVSNAEKREKILKERMKECANKD